MSQPLSEFARIPTPGDNAAIALRDLSAGTILQHETDSITLQHDVLTGHRFAITPIAAGTHLSSWRYPFGTAARDIVAGEYLCNQNVLYRLSIQEDPRYTGLKLPDAANFTDDVPAFHFDSDTWQTPAEVEKYSENEYFLGYPRGARGTGTRNHLVILGLSASTAPLVERIHAKLKDRCDDFDHIDAIVGLRHTEGAGSDAEENERTLRTLAGLIRNPNVGAAIVLESKSDNELQNAALQNWLATHPVDGEDTPIEWLTTSGSFAHDIERLTQIVEPALIELNTCKREQRSLSELRIGLQCGASDAFSGICGNVLSAAIAREVIRNGGSANLTETPELSGAEDYTLASITRPEIAPQFLTMLDRFKEQLRWHGGKVDKNPSEGNLLGGLYNITLKSLGAAVKRDPEIPIAHIIEYAQAMHQPGFYFMDGMGGDIASYTGQAAAGCNIILFVTGRGTPTNASIVPTIKIVNTTERYQLMADDIDINAGQYLEGQSMDALTRSSLDQVIHIASGQRTLGEQRNQNIDLLWRQKFFKSAPTQTADSFPSQLDGTPLQTETAAATPVSIHFEGIQQGDTVLPRERIGLLIPTVGCSIATAEQATQRLSNERSKAPTRLDRYVTLSNTEGCGTTTGAEILNFILSYANHPKVDRCAFISLGCEMVSLSYIKSLMRGDNEGFPEIAAQAKALGITPEQFGWLTIQACGGTAGTIDAIIDWFAQQHSALPTRKTATGTTKDVRLALHASNPVPDEDAQTLGKFAAGIIQGGGTIVLMDTGHLLASQVFRHSLGITQTTANLAFAQTATQKGLFIMQQITANPMEAVTGLGASSDLILNYADHQAIAAHALTPTLNLSGSKSSEDFDGTLQQLGESGLAKLIGQVLSNTYTPRQNANGCTGNQVPRGPKAHVI